MDFKEIDRCLHLSREELAGLGQERLANIILEMRRFVYDPLTGLRDRRQFLEGLEDTMENNTAMILFDVDNFKSINDAYGHSCGDGVLRLVGQIIGINSRCKLSRKSDVIRYGGEEFLVILPEMDIFNAEKYANRIRVQVEENPFLLPNLKPLKVTLSGGISHFDKSYDPHKDKRQMVMEADLALYASKRAGRNRISLFQGYLRNP